MSKLGQLVILLLTVVEFATAQIQKSPNNRVYVDDDYEYTETARRTRSVNAHVEKGSRFFKSGDYYAAREAFHVAATLDPSVFVSQFNLGVTHLHLSDTKSAINCLQQAVTIDRASASAWHFLGFALYQAGNNAEAKSRRVAPSLMNAYYLAWSYLDLQKFPDAIEPGLSVQLFDQIYKGKIIRLMK